jgi:hypothetical protein
MYGKTTISLTGRRGSVSGIENISFSSAFFIAFQVSSEKYFSLL